MVIGINYFTHRPSLSFDIKLMLKNNRIRLGLDYIDFEPSSILSIILLQFMIIS